MSKFRGLFVAPAGPLRDSGELARVAFEAAGGKLVEIATDDRGEIIEALKDVDVAMGSINPDANIFAAMDRCKGIVTGGHGYDRLDLQAATDNGIILANLASFGTEEVSNHALMLLLVCARKFVLHDKLVKSGNWTRQHLPPMGHVSGETLGLIGTGNIGRALGRKCRALGMRILAYDPYATSWDLKEYGFETAQTVEEVCKEADYLSIHTPLTPETTGLVGEKQFKIMKHTAYVINCSRGKVVDESALINALEMGQIAGAGLDVFEEEPTPDDNPLLQMDNVATTGHYASYSETAFERAGSQMGEEAVRIAMGYWPMSLINPAVQAVIEPRKTARAWGTF